MKSLEDVRHFIDFAAKELKIKQLPSITFLGRQKNSYNTFSTFDKKTAGISVRVTDRHPIDIARSISHELIHYKQLIDNSKAKERIKEDDANKLAGRIMQKYDKSFPNVFKDTSIKEDTSFGSEPIATNQMSTSSSTASTGPIDTYDPSLINKKKTLKDVLKKKKNGSRSSKQ